MSVENNKTAILPCPEFDEVVKSDGAYRFVKWYMWTSNGLDDPHWKWFIGMNQDGVTNPLKGFNISKENGSLCIHEAKPCDARRFMCVVDRINGTSPKRHFVTLQLKNGGKNFDFYLRLFEARKSTNQKRTGSENEHLKFDRVMLWAKSCVTQRFCWEKEFNKLQFSVIKLCFDNKMLNNKTIITLNLTKCRLILGN